MEILRGSVTPIPFFLALSSDHETGATGKSPVALISKAGSAFALPSVGSSVVERGNGWYDLIPTAADTTFDGPLILHCVALAGTDPVDEDYVVGRDAVVVGETTPIVFFHALSTDHITGAIGLSPAVVIAKTGAGFSAPAGTVAEIGYGWYKLTPTAADTGVAGSLKLHSSAATADPEDLVFAVETPAAAVVLVQGFSRTQLIQNAREVMDAVASSRWSDTAISGVLGLVHRREWSGILAANPHYRLATRSVTSASDGTLAYTALNSGSGDASQLWYRILAITDGEVIYRQTTFADNPLAASSGAMLQYDRMWYDAGSSLQLLPTGAVPLSVTVNWLPPRIDQLSADSVVVDFPDGHEAILWLEAAAMLLSKGGAENAGAQTMRAMADQERQTMYADLQRRSARPIHFGYPDRASDWGA